MKFAFAQGRSILTEVSWTVKTIPVAPQVPSAKYFGASGVFSIELDGSSTRLPWFPAFSGGNENAHEDIRIIGTNANNFGGLNVLLVERNITLR